MEQTWKCFLALLLTCSITARSSECRILRQVSEGTSVPYTETPAAGRSCSTVCPSPLLFANVFKTQPASYACIGKGDALGFQSGAGSTTCLIASGNEAVEVTDYSCMCLAASSLPGLASPDASGSCTSACKPFAGETGSSVSMADSSLCMATSEAGSTNHFGLASNGSCTYISGKAVSQTKAFSCVCAYGGLDAVSSSIIGGPPLQTSESQTQTTG